MPTTKELLELASTELSDKVETKLSKNKSVDPTTEVKKFINHFDIQAGSGNIPPYMLYQVYLDYKATRPKGEKTPQNRRIFLRIFSSFFKTRHMAINQVGDLFYSLDLTKLNIFTKDEYDALYWKSRQTIWKQREKDNKKKQNKKSKSQEEV